ncbi:alanine racemase [Paenibacillus sp. TRM 82003]|nr:alanine racemase [Paenibacillus sp. TRM 82003]
MTKMNRAEETGNIGFRNTWVEVGLDAIRHNVKLFRRRLAGDCKLMAVVKANGYGHGAAESAAAALDVGAERLGVAIIEEAIALRDAGFDCPLLVLGYTPPAGVETAVRRRIALTVFSEEVLDAAIAAAERAGRQAILHLKYDTGMRRIGAELSELLALARKAAGEPSIALEGVYTHFASADDADPTFVREQFERFRHAVALLREEGIAVPIKHCCNSAAAMRFPDMHLDMVRVGIALYGQLPASDWRKEAPAGCSFYTNKRTGLRPAFALKTSIAMVKYVSAGETVSYGRTFAAAGPSVIATLPIGYADGLSRMLSNRGFALIGGREAPIVGRICMDQTMIDVTSIPDASVGDEVVLIGCSGERSIAVDDVADRIGTINYEVVCLVGRRVPRRYG